VRALCGSDPVFGSSTAVQRCAGFRRLEARKAAGDDEQRGALEMEPAQLSDAGHEDAVRMERAARRGGESEGAARFED
jgi:hypothetical protein